MTLNQNSGETAWWESELPAIRAEYQKYLRRRLPALREDHDDLLSETMFALSAHINRRVQDLPMAWFRSTVPANEDERLRLYKLGMLILKRRIADLLRLRSSHRWFATTNEPSVEAIDPQPIPDRQIMIRRLLEVTANLLDEMEPEDRDLVALVSREPGFRQSLNPRERKRLQRIREKLKARIAERLGDEVTELLRMN